MAAAQARAPADIAAGGRRIAQHAADGVVLKEIASGRYRTLVLQEWGGGLLCGEQQARPGFDGAASQAAHRQLADAAHVGQRTLPARIRTQPQAQWPTPDGHPGSDLTLWTALEIAHALYGDAPLSTPFEITCRDYRRGATPKADALASAQRIPAQRRVRTVRSEDPASPAP